MPTNLTGQMLGKVRVDMFLARGGMADVFVGTHTTLHRAVAIKFLKGDLQDEPDLRERFEREARVIAMLRHPNIVQVYDFDTHDNQPYLVMEYVAGASLASFLRDLHKGGQRLEYNQITRLLNKLAGALQYAHDNHVIHRDIKPANILLTSRTTPVEAGHPLPEDAEPIITDFGLVRFTQSNKQTSTGVITGTPAYMSPEQALGNHVDARTDVYSLAVTVYEMLAGRVPFDSDSTLSLLHKQLYDPPPPIGGISDELQAVMSRALAKAPEERYSSTMEFAEAFTAALRGTTEASTLIMSQSELQPSQVNTIPQATIPGAPAAARPTTKWIAVGLTGVVLLIAGAFALSRPKTSVPPNPTTEAQQHSDMTSVPAVSETPVTGGIVSEPIGLLRFQDGTALADQVTLSISGLDPLPEGQQYEGWLVQDDGEQIISIGVLELDQDMNSTLTFVDPKGRNLIGLYNAVLITTEPKPDSNPIPSMDGAISSSLPSSSFAHVRHLLYSFSGNPNQIGFMDGLDTSTKLIHASAEAMLAAFDSGNDAEVSLQAEQMINLIVGDQSTDHKDWNNNGTVDDPGDGFGLLLNGDNEGYIQGSASHASFATSAPDATENMRVHGEHVAIAVGNVSEWTPQLRDVLIAILTSTDDSAMEGLIRQAVAFANQIRNGVDINGNENIEAIAGEGGAITAYQHAYYMADITIFVDSTGAPIPAPTIDPNASPESEPPGYN